MEPITLRTLLDVVGGTLLGGCENLDTTITCVDTDSRSIRPGSLFIPLEGERFDAHAFIPAALDAGAAGCLTAKVRQQDRPGKFYVKVESTQRALRDLARWYRGLFSVPVIAITGSVGKTTTKDMVAAVLGERYRVHKTQGNFNNNIGLPLTVLELDRTHEMCVLEMGMNHAGEIDYLADIARPDVALITNIGDCHIEYLGSREGIFKAKCEVFSHMNGGTAILNGDDGLLTSLRGKLPMDTLFVGTESGLDYTARALEGDGEGHMSCTIETPRASFRAAIPALGQHMVYPALMAAAVGELYGMTPEEIVRGIGNFLPTKMRMNVLHLPGGVTVLDDAYNANPQSMRAAAAVLRDVPGKQKVAVVGDMMELGENSAQFHHAVGLSFGELGTDCLIAVGTLSAETARGAQEGGVPEVLHFEGVEQAIPAVKERLAPETVILAKASRAMHFEEVVKALSGAAAPG